MKNFILILSFVLSMQTFASEISEKALNTARAISCSVTPIQCNHSGYTKAGCSVTCDNSNAVCIQAQCALYYDAKCYCAD